MKFELIRPPSWKRFTDLRSRWGKISLTRALQYEELSELCVSGSLVDIGGGEKTPYRSWLRCHSYDSVNISGDSVPTWVVNETGKWPVEDSKFDAAISMNTLEHVFDAELFISEIVRITKPGGRVVIATPFLLPIHGCPDDYFRPTPSWYSKTFEKAGLVNIKVKSLVWGPFSTGAKCSGLPGPAKRLRMSFAMALDLFYYRIRSLLKGSNMRHDLSLGSLAFWVEADKAN